MEHISKVYESNKATYICADCMAGRHEVVGNTTCLCVCHNNPTCGVCGDICNVGEWGHTDCIANLDDQTHERMMEALHD